MTRPQLRDDLQLMAGYHSPQVDVAVRLNTNESPVGPPPAWQNELATELERVEWNRYPDRAATALRTAIARQYGVEASAVFAANGSNEALQAILLAYGGSGRTAAVFEPTYALHSHISRITGTAVVVGERGPDFDLDVREVDRLLAENPDVIFLCSPNNPTGMIENRSIVETVVERATEDGSVVVVDEAYGQFAEWSAIELVGEDRNVVVTRTFSKTWSLAGARLGYLIGPTWLVESLDSVTLPYHLDTGKQVAGSLALRYVDEMRARVDQLVSERERVASELARLPVDSWPSGANFILFRPRTISGEALWMRLLDRSILVRNCASWPRLEGCLRVTIGTPEENDAFLAALTEILNP